MTIIMIRIICFSNKKKTLTISFHPLTHTHTHTQTTGIQLYIQIYTCIRITYTQPLFVKLRKLLRSGIIYLPLRMKHAYLYLK
jgi:hypothetical protein